MQSTNDVFTNAFQLLASSVREFHINGRTCLGATLKPRLYQQHFDEKLLGFRKFGDFLRAAEAAGYVRLAPTVGGDIGISPGSGLYNPETPPHPSPGIITPTFAMLAAPSATSSSAAPIRVRQDLWNAFNSLSDNWVYDPATDSAFRDTQTVGAWGGQGAASRPNTVPIPSGRERVTEWMRSFANMQDSDVRAQLSGAIERSAGLYEFNNLTRCRGLLRFWSRFHVQNVLAAIEVWCASNNLHPKNVASPLHLPAPAAPQENKATTPVAPEVKPPASTPSAPLNSRLELLIDNLIDELISLRGLLQVVGPRRSE